MNVFINCNFKIYFLIHRLLRIFQVYMNQDIWLNEPITHHFILLNEKELDHKHPQINVLGSNILLFLLLLRR